MIDHAREAGQWHSRRHAFRRRGDHLKVRLIANGVSAGVAITVRPL
jgi:hypothetical protein